jgi:hypothetical protein
MRILVVDDEMEILSLLKDSLEDEGLTEEEEDFIIWDENNQREDLNLYDKVRFHLRFIKRTFNFNDDKEAISFIHNCHFYKKQEDASKENKDEVVKLELLLNKLGSYKTVSSLMNNLQVLNFNELVLDASSCFL